MSKNFLWSFLLFVMLMPHILLRAQPPPCAANPIAGDFCSTATAICNLNGYCGNTSSFYTNDVSPTNGSNETNTPLGDVFCATIQNNSWLKFIADSTIAVFHVWCSNCQNNNGIQMQIYSTTDCYNFDSVSNCWNPHAPVNGQITAHNLVVGETYYFMIDGTAGDVCDYVIACDVGVNVSPVISPSDTICFGTTKTITALGGLGYSWTSSPFDPSLNGQQNNSVINVSPTSTTTYTVIVANPGLNNFCTTDTTILSMVITVNNVSAYVTGSVTPFCDQANGAITVIGTGGTGGTSGTVYNYLWSTVPPQTTASITGIGAGTYTLTVSNNDCSRVQNFTLSPPPPPQVTIQSSANAYCNQPNGNALAAVLSGVPPFIYLWNTTPAQTTASLQNVSGGNYTITVTDSMQCIGTAMVTIIDIPAPVVTLSAQTSHCQNSSPVLLSGGSPAGGTYSGNGVSGSLFDPAVTGVGVFPITYSYVDAFGCSGAATQSLSVLVVPNVLFSSLPDLCADADPLVLTVGSPAGGTYTGTGVLTGIFDPAVSGPGTFNLTYSYKSANGCSNSAVQTILIRALPNVQLTAFPFICIEAPAFALAGGSPSGGTYTGQGITNGIFDPHLAGLGVFPVTYSYEDVFGCHDTAMRDLTVNPLPLPFHLNGGGLACKGTDGVPVGLDSSQAGIDYYLILNGWIQASPFPGTGLPIDFGNQPVAGWYSAQAVDPFSGCNSLMADTVYIKVLPSPVVDLGKDMYLCDLPYIMLDAGTYADTVSYEWQNGSVDRYFKAVELGNYSVKVYLGNCFGENDINIEDCSLLEMPNVFTPNTDGKNDRFKPKKVGEIVNYTLEIFNRWGTKVYESNDLEEGWDGSLMNVSNDCPDGVYFFVASYMAYIYPQPDRLSKLSGTVTLIR